MATYKPKKKIDNNGTLEDVKIPIESVDGLADEFKKMGVHFIPRSAISVGAGGSTLSKKWTVNGVDGITEPFDGMVIAVDTHYTSPYQAGIILSLDNGETYYPLVMNATRLLQDEFPTGTMLLFVFSANRKINNVYIENGVATSITGCWSTADYYKDESVKQTQTTAGSEFPILTKTSSSSNSTNGGTFFNENITANHYKGSISAKEFKENGVSLADKYALKDEAGGNCFENLSRIDLDDQAVDGVDIAFDGVSFHNYYAFYGEDDEVLGASTTTIKAPFVAGDGIEFAQAFDGSSIKIKTDLPTEEVEAIDLPTVRAKLKPASEVGGGSGFESVARIDSWANTPTDIEILGEDGVAWNEDFEFYDKDDNTIAYGTMAHRIPIVAGNGIEFIQETDAPVVSINATGGGSGNKPPAYINKSVDFVELFDETGIYYGTSNRYYNGYDLDTDLLGEGTEETVIPISAGDGIVFEQDDENHSVKISANNHYKSFTKNLDNGLNDLVDFIELDSHGCIGKGYCYFSDSFTFRDDTSSSGETLLGGLYEIIQFNFTVYIKNIGDNSVKTTTTACTVSAINGNTTVECATQIIRQGM